MVRMTVEEAIAGERNGTPNALTLKASNEIVSAVAISVKSAPDTRSMSPSADLRTRRPIRLPSARPNDRPKASRTTAESRAAGVRHWASVTHEPTRGTTKYAATAPSTSPTMLLMLRTNPLR